MPPRIQVVGGAKPPSTCPTPEAQKNSAVPRMIRLKPRSQDSAVPRKIWPCLRKTWPCQKHLALPQKDLASPQKDLAMSSERLGLSLEAPATGRLGFAEKDLGLSRKTWLCPSGLNSGQGLMGPWLNLDPGSKPFRGTLPKLFSF